MMKIVQMMLATLLLLSGAVQADHHHSEPQTLRVGIFQMNPICFTNETGEARGFIPDIIRAAFPNDEGWHIEYVPGTWAEHLNQLQSGSIDLIPCITYTSERAESMDFSSESAFESWAQVCALQNKSIETWDDLQNKTIAIMSKDINGINFIKTAELLGIQCRTKEYPTHAEVLRAVQTMQAEAGVAPNLFVSRHASTYGLRPTTILFSPSPAFFAVKKGTHANIIRQLDERLGAWKREKNSIYYQSLNRWLTGILPAHPSIPLWFWIVVGGAGSIAALLFGANRLLQHKVQKRTAELRASEERFEIATEAGGIGVWDRDIINNRLIWDDRMYELYGVRKENFGGAYEAWQQSVHPDDLDRAVAEVTAAELGEKPFDTEFRIVRPNGEIRHIRAFAKIIHDKKGNPIRMTGTNQDITERVKSSEQFRMLFESTPSGGAIYRPVENNSNFVFVDLNLSGLRNANLSREEVVGRKVTDVFPGVKESGVFDALQRVAETGKPEKMPLKHYEDSHIELWVENQIFKLPDGLIVAVYEDTTEKHQAQEALKKREAEFRSTLEDLLVGVVVHAADSSIVFSNPRAQEILGLSADQITGKTAADPAWCFVDEDLSVMDVRDYPVTQAITTGKKTTDITLGIKRPDREEITWAQASAIPVFTEQNQLSRVIVNFMDITVRKNAEEKARADHDLARGIIDHGPIGITVLNSDGVIVEANERAQNILRLKISDDETLYYNDPKWKITAVDGTALPEEELPFRRVCDTGKPAYDVQHAITNPAGERRILAINAAPLYDASATMERVVCSIEDITERLEALNQLKEREFLLAKSQEMGHIGTWFLDIEHNILSWTEEAHRIFGVSAGTPLTYETFLNCVHPDDRDFVNSEWAARVKTNDYDIEHRLLVNEVVRWVREKAEITFNENGEPVSAIGLTQDITEGKEAEQKLQESEEKLRGIIENSTNMFYSHTPDHVLTYISPQVKDILGYEVEEALKRWTELTTDHPVNKQGFELTERAIQTAKAQPTYELELRHKDGHAIWVEVREAPKVEDGKTLAIVGSLTDITARKAAEATLQERMKELQRFNKASVGRELRMIELKKEITSLSRELGRKDPYGK